MRKTLLMLMIIVMTFLCVTSCSQDKSGTKTNTGETPIATAPSEDLPDILEGTPTTPITINVSNANVSVGDVFSIMVNIENDEWTWSSFEFVVNFDPSVMKVTELRSTELTESMMNLGNVDYGNGQAKAAYATGKDMVGGGDILEIVCEAIADGSCDVTLTEASMFRGVTIAATGEGTVRAIDLKVNKATVSVTK